MKNNFRYVTPVSPKEAQGEIATLYQLFRQELGLIPEPLTLHASSLPLLFSFWGAFRAAVLVGTASRGEKEAVAAAVSDSNHCAWCVDAHTTMLYATKNPDVAQTILHNRTRLQLPQNMRALLDWGYATGTPDAYILAHPPFPAEQAGEFLGTALIFQYLNRMVSILLSETFLPTTPWMRAAMRQLGGKKFSSAVQQKFTPAKLAGVYALSEELQWMEKWPTVAQAFSIWEATLADLGAQALPTPVRELVDEHVVGWDGRDLGLSRKWVEDAVASLTADQRPTGRVALLAALAPHQVDASLMQAYMDLQPDPGLVISGVAWASWRATRRIGTWLYPIEEPLTADPKHVVFE
jgi:AhpD family alkylhydroperoxidase